MDPMSGFDIRLVFTLPPRDSHCSTKDVYTSEITVLALHPWSLYSSVLRVGPGASVKPNLMR